MDRRREGDLYKTIQVGDRIFEIRYGYNSEVERGWWDPAPVYPDFAREPQYTADGHPYAMASQDVCMHYIPKPQVSGEEWCNDCTHFQVGMEAIGICTCLGRKYDFGEEIVADSECYDKISDLQQKNNAQRSKKLRGGVPNVTGYVTMMLYNI